MFNFIGKVVNQKNLPIKDAKVSFEGLGTPLVNHTDGEGVFRFPINIIRGNIINVNIRVEAEGYKPYNRYTELSIDNKNLEEIRLIENDIENSSKPPVAINVAKIGAIATVAAALIGGGAMLLSNLINGKTPTPQPTSQPSTEPINSSPNISQKPRTNIEVQSALIGTWKASTVEFGQTREIFLVIKPDGTEFFTFKSVNGSQMNRLGNWQYSNDILTERMQDGEIAKGSVEFMNSNYFVLTILENGGPGYAGLKRHYYRYN